jgi:hypothetical protein
MPLTVTERKRAKALRKEADRRRKTEKWYPSASDLTLPDVPLEHRERIRARIAPWLETMKHVYDDKRVPVKAGDCWHIAQAFVLTAASPDVKYVEGVWNPLRSCASDQCECCREPKPHGWATVEGYIICLPSEFLRWQGDTNRYSLYEIANVYTYEELVEQVDEAGMWDILSQRLGDFQYEETDDKEENLKHLDEQSEHAFGPVVERFKQRFQSDEVFAYA